MCSTRVADFGCYLRYRLSTLLQEFRCASETHVAQERHRRFAKRSSKAFCEHGSAHRRLKSKRLDGVGGTRVGEYDVERRSKLTIFQCRQPRQGTVVLFTKLAKHEQQAAIHQCDQHLLSSNLAPHALVEHVIEEAAYFNSTGEVKGKRFAKVAKEFRTVAVSRLYPATCGDQIALVALSQRMPVRKPG